MSGVEIYKGASSSAVSGAAIGQLQILDNPGGSKRNRIYRILLTCDQSTTLTLSDNFGIFYSRTGHSLILDYGSIGRLAETSNTALGVTSAKAANVGALTVYSVELA